MKVAINSTNSAININPVSLWLVDACKKAFKPLAPIAFPSLKNKRSNAPPAIAPKN